MLFFILLFSWFDWQTVKTKNFTVIYKPGYEWEAMQTLQNLEQYRQNVVDLTGNDTRNLPVVIEDIGTESNGFANPLFYNIHIFNYPPGFGSSLEGIEDWYRTVSVHEYTHIAHMTRTGGIPKFLTALFGAPFQMNMYSPGWIIEGITVFSESQISPYEGRLNDGFYDSYIGARVFAQKFPSIIETTNEPLSFPYGKIYLYGGEFFNFLSVHYGQEKFARFFKTYGSYPWAPLSAILPFTGLDIAAKGVYGKSFSGLFSEWQQYEKEHFANWQVEGERVTKKGWYISSLIEHNNKLYFVQEMPIKIDAFNYHNKYEIIELDIAFQKEKVIATLTSPVTTSLRIFNDALYYTTLEIKRGTNVSYNGFRVTSVLHKKNLLTLQDKVLFKDDIRSFCVLPDSSILYTKDRPHEFGSELWHDNNGIKEKVWQEPYLINELAADSNYGVYVARKTKENWNIYGPYGELTPIANTPWIEASVNLKDSILIFTANYDKIYSIYLFNINENKFYRLTKNGYANFGEIIGDTLYFIGLSKSGFDIYKKSVTFEEFNLPNSQFEPKSESLNDKIEFSRGGYGDVFKTLFPAWRIPVFLPADTTFKKWLYGAMFLGGDATDENIYGTYLAYDQLKNSFLCQTSLYSSFFSPCQINLFYNYNDYISVATGYPLINRLSPGFSQVSLLFNGESHDDYKRKEIAPGFRVVHRLPYSAFFVTAFIPLERKFWKSSIDRTAYIGNLGLSQVMLNGELRVNVRGYLDDQNPDMPAISIRGYKSIATPCGATFTTEYSHRLLNLRWGLWNPNIYFEDLFGAVFFDFGITNNKESYYSVGLEIKLETKIAFGFVPLTPKLGIAWTKEKEWKPFFEVLPMLYF